MMKKRIALTVSLIMIYCMAFGESFFNQYYDSKSPGHADIIKEQLQQLYNQDEDIREDFFELLEDTVDDDEAELKKGDNIVIYATLTKFILGEGAPAAYRTNTDFKDDIADLQEDAIDLFIDRVKDDDVDISEREYLAQKLNFIMQSERLAKFDFNSMIFVSYFNMLKTEDNPLIRHTLLAGIKNLPPKTGKQWETMTDQAARLIIERLNSQKDELRHLGLVQSIDILRKSEVPNVGNRLIWDAVKTAVSKVEYGIDQKGVKHDLGLIVDAKMGSFAKEAKIIRGRIDKIEVDIDIIDDPLDEILEDMEDEEDPDDLEEYAYTLKMLALKDRAVLNIAFWSLFQKTLSPEIELDSLRIINAYLLEMVNESGDPLYYHQTVSALLGQIHVHRNEYLAIVPLSQLVRHLGSTDYPGLVLPALQNFNRTANSNLPGWIQRKLLTLVYLQASDSPNDKIAVKASEYLWETASESEIPAVRIEAMDRLSDLAERARNRASRNYAKTKI